MNTAAELSIEQRFFTAVTTGDAAAMREIYAPDVAVWHNYDGLDQTCEDSIRTLMWLHRRVGPLNYRDIETIAIDDGFVRSHVAVLGGGTIVMPAMLRVRTDPASKHILRIEEYVDPTPLNDFLR